MKRTAITSLIIVFLTCQFSYAARPSGNLMPTKEETQELTQEEIEGVFIALLSLIDRVLVDRESIDWEEFIGKIEETQDIEPLLNPFLCVACFASIYILVTGLLGELVAVFVLMHIIPWCYGCLVY